MSGFSHLHLNCAEKTDVKVQWKESGMTGEKPEVSLSYITQPNLILWSLVLFVCLASKYV